MLVERRRAFSFCSQLDILPPFFFSMLAQWIQRHVEPQAESLLEQSARGLAESWMELDCVVSELKAMGESRCILPSICEVDTWPNLWSISLEVSTAS